MTTTETPLTRPRTNLGSRRRIWIASVIVLAAFGFLLWRGLGNATVFFRTADEAVAQKASLGDRRFRVEGTVAPGTVKPADDRVRFVIEENGARINVVHRGDPPELFKPGIPVVLEGHWSKDVFASDRIMVKHSSDYRAEHPDRVENSPQ